MTTNGAPNLRPLGIGEVLDAALKVYRVHFKTLSLAVLIPIFAVSALQALLLVSVDTDEFATSEDGSFSAPDGFWGVFIGSVLLLFLAGVLAFAASFHAVIRGYLADGTTWQESLKSGLRRLLPLILLIVVAFVIFVVLLFVMGMLVAIFWPLAILFVGFMIWMFVRMSVAAPAVLAERAGPFKALARSFELVKGRWWPVFGAVLAMLILVIVFYFLSYYLLGLMFADPDSDLLVLVVATLVRTVQWTIALPIVAAVSTILYYDLRVRKEGYDLQLAAGGLSDVPVAVTAGATTGGFGGGFTAPSEGGFAPPSGGGFSAPPEPAAPVGADPSIDTSRSQPPPGFGGGGGLAVPTPAPPTPPAPEPEPASSGFSEPAHAAPEPKSEPAPTSSAFGEPAPAAPEPEPEPAGSAFGNSAPASPEPEPTGSAFGEPTAQPDPAPGTASFGEPAPETETEPGSPEPAEEPAFSWSPTPAEEDESPAPPPPGEEPPPAAR